MNLAERFREVVEILQKEKIRFAVAGGITASLYRQDERLTKDIDFLIATDTENEEKSSLILKQLGLTPSLITDADLAGGPLFKIKNKNGIVMMVIGRAPNHTSIIGVDFILPKMPWATEALERAQYMKVDFGFGELPVLTVEDVIISKLYAFKNDSTRLKDCDDIQSILLSKRELDLPYLAGRMRAYRLPIPKQLASIASVELNRISKSVEREIRRDLAKKRGSKR